MTDHWHRLHNLHHQTGLVSKHCPNLHKVFSHPYINGLIIITVVTFDIAELVNDWLLYIDLTSIKPGLVYGPLESWVTVLFLIICLTETLLFIFEILNLLWDIAKGSFLLDSDLVSAAIIWTDQIPMIIINVFISMCHDEPLSYFQLSKAFFIGIAIIIRAITPFLQKYLCRNRYCGNEGLRNYIYRILTTIGLCLLLVGCVLMLIFSHVIGADKQRFKLLPPEEMWTGNSIQEKYFTNVGIYMEVNRLGDYRSGEQQFWIKLTDVLECYKSNPLYVKLSILESNNVIQKIALHRFSSQQGISRKCYRVISSIGAETTFSANCSTFETFPMTLVFKFLLVPSQWKLILGDIAYNALVVTDGNCLNIWGNSTGIYYGSNTETATMIGTLLYQKEDLNPIRDSVGFNLAKIDMIKDISVNGKNLTAAKPTWKTGLLQCQCTGKSGPTLDISLNVPC